VPTRSHPHIAVEEVDDSEVIMRVFATPELDRDGPRLADEILAALAQATGTGGSNGSNGSAG
jgi:small conductance mechanosensitive channel